MDYILELGMCQSPVTVSAYLPAVAQGMVRGVRGTAVSTPALLEPPPSLGVLQGLPQPGPSGPDSQKALTALGFSLSAASYSPPIPSLGIPLSALPQPLSQRVFL